MFRAYDAAGLVGRSDEPTRMLGRTPTTWAQVLREADYHHANGARRERPPGRHHRHRPVPGPRRAARGDDAGRPGRPRHQGRDPRHAATTPAAGDRRSSARRTTAVSTYFLSCNRNKESIALDLKSDDGRGPARRLVRQADVLLENFRPGVLDRLGFSVDRLHELNPRLVVLSITGFGHDGPEGGRAGYDQIAQGEAGLMSLTGPDARPPAPASGVPIGDLLAGMYGAYGVVAALHERNATGRGRVVRTSLLAAIVGVHAFQGTRYTVAGEVPHAQGNHHPSITPYGLFRCKDGMLQIAVGSEGLWQKFASALRPRPRRAGVWPPTPSGSATATASTPPSTPPSPTARWPSCCPSWRGPVSPPARSARSTGSTSGSRPAPRAWSIDVDHPVLGRIELPGPPLRFDDNAARRRPHRAPAPAGAR